MRSERTVVAILVVLCGLTAGPAPAGAQTGTTFTLPGGPGALVEVAGVLVPPSVLQPGRPVLQLSVDEAVALALEQNVDLRVERLNPLLESNVFLQYNQPLLRNLGIDGSRLQIAITSANRDISDIALRATIVQTERAVRLAYWNLHYGYVSLEVARQSLELAEESLRNNRRRVEVGTLAGINIVSSESEVARNEESVIISEANLDTAEDQLRTLIFEPDAPDFWAIRIQPSDDPTLRAAPIDIDAAVRNAQNNRTDLDTLDKQIENTDTTIRYYRNQRLPDVDLQVNYSLNGAGGTELLRGQGFLGKVTGTEVTSFGSVLGDLLSNDFPTWRVGVTLRYELGNSFAKANLQRARLERTQDDGRRRSLEVQIAQEVRAAGRSVVTDRQRVQATRTALQLFERRLAAEQRQLDLGQSTTFFVVQAQRDLENARNREALAILAYARSLVNFEAVQEIPLFGGF